MLGFQPPNHNKIKTAKCVPTPMQKKSPQRLLPTFLCLSRCRFALQQEPWTWRGPNLGPRAPTNWSLGLVFGVAPRFPRCSALEKRGPQPKKKKKKRRVSGKQGGSPCLKQQNNYAGELILGKDWLGNAEAQVLEVRPAPSEELDQLHLAPESSPITHGPIGSSTLPCKGRWFQLCFGVEWWQNVGSWLELGPQQKTNCLAWLVKNKQYPQKAKTKFCFCLE